jgi:hypothetical protein
MAKNIAAQQNMQLTAAILVSLRRFSVMAILSP